jgi:GT2 family glycosyltransferase
MNTISVHIVTYNSEKYIEDCINSVLKQSYFIHSIIVVDNDSNDQTKQILRKFDSITLIENTKNNGFAGGHNQAIKMSSCNYYLVLNPDVVLHPDYVFRLMHEFDTQSNLGSTTGRLLFKQHPDTVDSTGLIINKARRAFDRGAGDKADNWKIDSEVFGVSGAAALYSKKMVDDISLEGCFFDEDFFAYKEDVDVAWRSRLLGWTAYYCSDAIAYHDRGWKKGGRNVIPLFVRKLSYINRYKMIIKNDTIIALIKHMVPFIIYEMGSFVYFVFREPGVLLTWGDLIKKLPRIIYKRHLINQKRKGKNVELYKYFK